jgi:ABC-type spermidine/putrescine transport system permease subunit I
MNAGAGRIDGALTVPEAKPARRRRWRHGGLLYAVPLTVMVAVCFNVPLLMLLTKSLQGEDGIGTEQYRLLFASPVYLDVVRSTLRVATTTTVVCVILGYPLAHWISELRGGRRALALSLVVLPFWVSVLVRTYSWIIILGFNGTLNRVLLELGLVGSPLQLVYNRTGVIVGMSHVLLPFVVFPLVAAMVRIDRRYELAGASLGARPRQVFWSIYLPLTAPALAAGAALTFILALGFFITPAILGGGKVSMIATVLDTLVNRQPRWELASALAVVLLLIASAAYALSRLAARAGR